MRMMQTLSILSIHELFLVMMLMLDLFAFMSM
jgi:hypothetical protein